MLASPEGDGKYPRYSLRLARYRGAAEAIDAYLRESGGATCKLLDVGVGRGRILHYLRECGSSGQVQFFGVDNSQRRLANIHDPKHWRLQRGDVVAGLPFASDAFDIVLCEQVLEHLADPERAVREIVRVARPGALVVLGVPIFPPGIADVRRCMVPAIDRIRGRVRSHLQAFSLKSLLKLLADQGSLDIVAVRGFRFISGGPLRPLENSMQWYRFNRWIGRKAPMFAVEVQVVARCKAAA